MRLLIVEDDAPLASGLSRILEAEGHAVDVTSRGEEAVAAASQERFDLVILDIGLPQMDGFEVLRRLRAGKSENGGPVPVRVASVEQGDFAIQLKALGTVTAYNTVNVRSRVDGELVKVLFEEGQNVRAGDVLVRLRDDEQRARVSEAEANLQLAEEVNSRTHKLARRDAVSVARQDESAAQLAVARARLELARVALERTYVRAPFDGVLGMRLVSPGDRLENKTALVQIDAVDRLQVAFAISELGILFARVGTPVTINVAPYPNEQFPGEVFFVSPTLDPATRRIIVKAWVPNPGRRLRA